MNDSELEIGVIGRPHGVRGDVLVWLHNPSSPLFAGLTEVTLESADGKRRVLPLGRSKSGPKGANIVTSSQLDSRDEAEAIKGWKVLIDKAILAPIEDDDEFYYHELIGLSAVTPTGRVVGTIRSVIETSADILVIDLAGGGELMVPVVDHFVHGFERNNSVVRVVEDLESMFEDVL